MLLMVYRVVPIWTLMSGDKRPKVLSNSHLHRDSWKSGKGVFYWLFRLLYACLLPNLSKGKKVLDWLKGDYFRNIWSFQVSNFFLLLKIFQGFCCIWQNNLMVLSKRVEIHLGAKMQKSWINGKILVERARIQVLSLVNFWDEM